MIIKNGDYMARNSNITYHGRTKSGFTAVRDEKGRFKQLIPRAGPKGRKVDELEGDP